MSDPADPSSSSIHIRTTEHQLTKDEVVPVVYWQVFHQWQNWCLPVAGICLVIAGAAVLLLNSADKVAWVVMLTLGVVILLIFFAIVPVTPNRIWKRVKKQFELRTLEITDEGISRHTALNDSTLRDGRCSRTSRYGTTSISLLSERVRDASSFPGGRSPCVLMKRPFATSLTVQRWRTPTITIGESPSPMLSHACRGGPSPGGRGWLKSRDTIFAGFSKLAIKPRLSGHAAFLTAG
jgi:hypothetical protein